MTRPQLHLDLNNFILEEGGDMFRLDNSYLEEAFYVLNFLNGNPNPFSLDELATALDIKNENFNHFAHAVFWLEIVNAINNELDPLVNGPNRTIQELADHYNRGRYFSFVITKKGSLGLHGLERKIWGLCG